MTNKAPDETIWGTNIPTAGPVNPGAFTVGLWFAIDEPFVLTGFRAYSKGVSPYFAIWQVWDTTPNLVAEQAITAKNNQLPSPGETWRKVWLHPQTKLAANTPYLLVLNSGNDIWRNPAALASADFVNGHAKFYADLTSPSGHNGVYDAARIGSCYAFEFPPADDTGGNMYGIDIFYHLV